MTRGNARGAVVLFALVLLAGPFISGAQQVPRVALIASGPPSCPETLTSDALLRRLSELGYPSGASLVVDRRCYRSIDEVPEILAEVNRARPDVSVEDPGPWLRRMDRLKRRLFDQVQLRMRHKLAWALGRLA